MQINITKPLLTHKLEYITEVDSLASVKILAIYPLYKQNNISRLPTSEEALAMYDYIDSIRALTRTAKAVTNAATSVVEIRAAQATFVVALSAFSNSLI